MKSIVLVDDEVQILNALTRFFKQHGWAVRAFSSPQEALAEIRHINADVVMSDYRMPGMDGAMFLQQVREMCPDMLRIIMSGHADMEGVLKAINDAQIYRFITKPWSDAELLMALDTGLVLRALQKENAELAAIVRAQRSQLERQSQELKRLEQESPGITSVTWCEDGSIDMSNYMEEDDGRG